MFTVMVVGAGRIGTSIAGLLHRSGDFEVTVADHDAAALDRLPDGLRLLKLDARADSALLTQELNRLAAGGRAAVLSACSFDVNRFIACAALNAGVSYFDLTEDVETTQHIRQFAAQAADDQIFMPQCGLAPGSSGLPLTVSSMRPSIPQAVLVPCARRWKER